MKTWKRTERLKTYNFILGGTPGSSLVELLKLLRLLRDHPNALAVAGVDDEITLIADEDSVRGCRFDWVFPMRPLTAEEERWVRRSLIFSKKESGSEITE